jgi:hypothetical protein
MSEFLRFLFEVFEVLVPLDPLDFTVLFDPLPFFAIGFFPDLLFFDPVMTIILLC